MPNKIDETGNVYGRLTVINEGYHKNKRAHWECECSCGNRVTVLGTSLRDGNTKSCGCLNKEAAIKVGLNNSGELNGQWSGGETMVCGYPSVMMPYHPNARNDGYVSIHRLVMEGMLMRYLTSVEVIHHINNVRDDNREENLMLFPSQSEHMKWHRATRA